MHREQRQRAHNDYSGGLWVSWASSSASSRTHSYHLSRSRAHEPRRLLADPLWLYLDLSPQHGRRGHGHGHDSGVAFDCRRRSRTHHRTTRQMRTRRIALACGKCNRLYGRGKGCTSVWIRCGYGTPTLTLGRLLPCTFIVYDVLAPNDSWAVPVCTTQTK